MPAHHISPVALSLKSSLGMLSGSTPGFSLTFFFFLNGRGGNQANPRGKEVLNDGPRNLCSVECGCHGFRGTCGRRSFFLRWHGLRYSRWFLRLELPLWSPKTLRFILHKTCFKPLSLMPNVKLIFWINTHTFFPIYLPYVLTENFKNMILSSDLSTIHLVFVSLSLKINKIGAINVGGKKSVTQQLLL